jgi:hypothetical protein
MHGGEELERDPEKFRQGHAPLKKTGAQSIHFETMAL